LKNCWIIAGPNGAGKTTFAMNYLPNIAGCTNFVNADLIAAGLSPLDPDRETAAASRIFLKEIRENISLNRDFAFETTLSGRIYLNMVKKLKKTGWRVELVYLALPSRQVSKLRVAERVAHGGHNIPERDIERRFGRSIYNLLYLFSPIVDQCACFMNHADDPVLVYRQQGEKRDVFHQRYYGQLLKECDA